MPFTIYCDMDGVLTDFEKRATEVYPDWEKDEATLWKRAFYLKHKFFAHMDWMPDGKILWNYIKKYNPIILSAHPRSTKEYAIEGKRLWLLKNINSKISDNAIILPKKNKMDYACEKCILIDDDVNNIFNFRANNGIGILHKNSKSTIQQLKKLDL